MSFTSFVSILKTCEAAKGPGSRQVILDALRGADAQAIQLIHYALNPYIVYGVKKYDRPSNELHTTVDGEPTHFLTVLDKLADGLLTGNAAREAVAQALTLYTKETASYLERVIDKDLDAGFSAETFNSLHPDCQIPIFSVMLAAACKEEDFDELVYPRDADVKYDGIRHVMFVTNGANGIQVDHRSRQGKPATHYAGVFEGDLADIWHHLGHDFVVDGECMARNFTETMNAKKSTDLEAKSNLIFRIFAIMPLSCWMQKSYDVSHTSMRQRLHSIIETVKPKKLVASTERRVNDRKEMMAWLDEVTAPGFDGMPNGHEGLILKDPTTAYVWDRDPAWTKIKKFYDADARVISFEYGRKKYAKVMGRVNVAGWLEDGTYFECGVGSGWSDDLRKDIAENFDAYGGRTLVVRYQEVSKAKGKAHAALRFPTVDREKLFRDDKVVPLKDQ